MPRWPRASRSGREGQRVVELSKVKESQGLLRAKDATSQAGFTSERIPPRFFARRPILIDDGPQHSEHRKQLVRFFSPRTLDQQHRVFIEETAARFAEEARRQGTCQLDDLALLFSVRVASKIVGLTAGDTGELAKRLEAFFRQPPVDHTQVDYGRSVTDWMRAAKDAIVPLLTFYWRDVRPAIKAHRADPVDDVIGYLLERGYRPSEILMECLTYGTAGMVTTREFIAMAMLWLMNDPDLRARYVVAEDSERIAILSEIIRLEPPVAHLYRRVNTKSDACPYDPGTLVDINVREANLDSEVFGDNPDEVCPTRKLPASLRTGLSFGDGPHRCPGSNLALMETDILLRALLKEGAVLERTPERGFDTLVQGYQLRGFTLSFEPGEASS